MGHRQSLLVALLLSALFTIALVYATVEIPVAANSLLKQVFPDYGLTFEWGKAQELVQVFRPLGYVAFLCVLSLMAAGFVINRWRLTLLGALSLYLPVFGYFAFSMFFLAGVGFLRILWLPMLDVSPAILKLGGIVYLPYIALVALLRLLGIDAWIPLGFLVMSAGLFIFFLGATAWLYGRFKGVELVTFWIYRYSRHPQYLGFLLWSYGLLMLTSIFGGPRGGYIPPPSLPWLLLALAIISTAMMEEIAMTRRYEEEYLEYRGRTAFMIPLPRGISSLVTFPVRLVLKKEWPESKREIIYVITIYGTILVLLSLLMLPFF